MTKVNYVLWFDTKKTLFVASFFPAHDSCTLIYGYFLVFIQRSERLVSFRLRRCELRKKKSRITVYGTFFFFNVGHTPPNSNCRVLYLFCSFFLFHTNFEKLRSVLGLKSTAICLRAHYQTKKPPLF